MKQTIKFLRSSSTYASRSAAITALNALTHSVGQPVVARYTENSLTKLLLAIGKLDSSGSDSYEIIASYFDVLEVTNSLGTLSSQFSTHTSKVADTTLGHIKDGGDLNVQADGTPYFRNMTAYTVLGNNTNASARPTEIALRNWKAIEFTNDGGDLAHELMTPYEADSINGTFPFGLGDNLKAVLLGAGTDAERISFSIQPAPTFTHVGTAYPSLDASPASNDNSTNIATTAWVKSLIGASDAMIYKGTLGTVEDGGTVQQLPYSTAKTGWTYKVVTAGSYSIDQGVSATCEVGDMVICLTDATESTGATWTVVQNNIDGAVTGPDSSTLNHVATFNSTNGKVIKDSGMAVGSMVLASGNAPSGYITAFTADSSTGAKQIAAANISVTDILTKSDASSTYVPKTVSVTGSNGLTGGGTLFESRVISHATKPSTKPSDGVTVTPSSGTLVTSIDVDKYGHVATAGGVDLSVNGTASSGKYVSNVQWDGTTKTQLNVTYTTLPTHTESGKVKLTSTSTADYLNNVILDGSTTIPTAVQADGNAYPVVKNNSTNTTQLYAVVTTIDGGTF